MRIPNERFFYSWVYAAVVIVAVLAGMFVSAFSGKLIGVGTSIVIVLLFLLWQRRRFMAWLKNP